MAALRGAGTMAALRGGGVVMGVVRAPREESDDVVALDPVEGLVVDKREVAGVLARRVILTLLLRALRVVVWIIGAAARVRGVRRPRGLAVASRAFDGLLSTPDAVVVVLALLLVLLLAALVVGLGRPARVVAVSRAVAQAFVAAVSKVQRVVAGEGVVRGVGERGDGEGDRGHLELLRPGKLQLKRRWMRKFGGSGSSEANLQT
jgi:hypothetical protein